MACELERTDICNISNCIVNIGGMAADSASPTDIWFLTFNGRTTYRGQNIRNAFLKLFIDIDHTRISAALINTTEEINGLKYELNIYKDIIRPLVDLNICPNFVKYLASATNCSFDNLLNFLKGGKVLNGSHRLTNNEVETIFSRNILNCLLYSCDARPAINTIASPLVGARRIALLEYVKTNVKFSMILNEQTSPSTIKYSNFLRTRFAAHTMTPDILWETLFQVVAACYAMSLTKTVHNDLHVGNVFI